MSSTTGPLRGRSKEWWWHQGSAVLDNLPPTRKKPSVFTNGDKAERESPGRTGMGPEADFITGNASA
ncbi:hypothetical protein T01_9457 [Trichinella spiralis]|uniref:Uncharacterized protein n=1 Tax=Trichinella spiralis TaxID=6334 RepID=A0A0V1ASF0_TRISP|nr:hypothetical protein T01_9457 [Trichinella spiralis]